MFKQLYTYYVYILINCMCFFILGKNNLIIWGRYSWFSCPESVFPLANSLNVVLSKKLQSVPKHAHFISEDFDKAISLASKPPLSDSIEAIWILGGTQVYKEALEHPWCDLIYLTDIMADFDCDNFFPNFDQKIYRKQNRFPGVPSEIQEENGITFKFQVFKKET
ncbi:zgc:153031 isoform X2 [Trichomycterus rosablanca]|uniref:zgc:153031 isoform X2 n=1 Tax=Trichomycterus rosablanca TaxID=2290929 RepID=UPI002F357E72